MTSELDKIYEGPSFSVEELHFIERILESTVFEKYIVSKTSELSWAIVEIKRSNMTASEQDEAINGVIMHVTFLHDFLDYAQGILNKVMLAQHDAGQSPDLYSTEH